MNPADFLLIAEEGTDSSKTATVDDLMRRGVRFNSIPGIGFEHDGKGVARVKQHEGRHRARALLAAGVTRMPVEFVSLESGSGDAIRWGNQAPANWDTIRGAWPRVLRGEDGRGEIAFPVPDLRKSEGIDKYDPNQPRVPAGHSDGGQWTDGDGGGLPMDQESRLSRARDMGFDVNRVWYHGTTHDFDSFGGDTHNLGGHYGAGHYFTSDAYDASRNYAGVGPDLTNRIWLRADQISNEEDLDYDDPDALRRAREELVGPHEGALIPVYVRGEVLSTVPGEATYLDYNMTPPVEDYLEDARGAIDRADYTDSDGWFDEDGYNDAVNEYAQEMAFEDAGFFEPTGRLADVLNGLKYEMQDPDIYDADFDKVQADLADWIYDGGIRADHLEEILRKSDGLINATNENGQLVSADLIRRAYVRAGFDAIEMDATAQGWNMDIPSGTRHLIVTDPKNIRSIYAAFDPGKKEESGLAKYDPDQPRVPAGNPDGGQWTDAFATAGTPGGTDFNAIARKARDKVHRDRPRLKKDHTRIADLNKAMREAAEYQDWRDWYDRHESLIVEAFGPENAATFEKFLSAGSIQTTVSENVEESLRAFAHYIQGGRFDDGSFNTLLARERQYQQIADGGSVTGPKLIPFLAAMQGDVDAVAMDRHMRRIIFGEDAGSGHTAQTVVGQAVVRAIAKELGWEPRGVQAVLWVGRLMGEGSGVRATDYREQLLDHRDMITAIQNLPQFVRKADDPELFSLAELETAAENAAILVQAIIYLHEALGTTSPTPEQVRDFISPVSKWLKWLKWFKGS